MKNPYQVVKDFEANVAEYTGAPYVVAVDSCTNAIFLCLKWHWHNGSYRKFYADTTLEDSSPCITIPKRTYLSVPQQIMFAGFDVNFETLEWSGLYRLKPLNVWDSARRFTSGMFFEDFEPNFICTSHHWTKPLGIERGGCILHDSPEADMWFRRARFHGRAEGVHPKDDNPTMGWNMMMLPSVAANGLVRLSHLPRDNPDLLPDDYPDLSQMELFR